MAGIGSAVGIGIWVSRHRRVERKARALRAVVSAGGAERRGLRFQIAFRDEYDLWF